MRINKLQHIPAEDPSSMLQVRSEYRQEDDDECDTKLSEDLVRREEIGCWISWCDSGSHEARFVA